MKLRALEIRVLPGLSRGFSVDFEPAAVNVVTGPNASGKSSLVRAVRALLYPGMNPDYCELSAHWQRGDRTLVCERRGQQVQWLVDGRRAEAPNLPPDDAVGAFLISAEDLNALGSTEEHIAGHLRTLLAGGFDLDAVLETGELAPRPRPKKLAQEFSRLEQAVASKEGEYGELNDELATLERLRRQLDRTADAAGRLRACEDALALADATARLRAVEQVLIEEYPGGMDRLRGDELERLDQAEDALAQKEKELAIEHGALRKARERLKSSGPIDPQQLEALQAELGDHRDRLVDLEHRIEQQSDQIAQAEAALVLAARRLGRTPDRAEGLDQAALEELERRVDRVQALREQIRNLTGELARTHVSSNLTGRPQADLRKAREALMRWLDGARLSPLEGILWGGLSAAAGLASWRLLGVQQLEPLPELVMLILIAAGVPLSLLFNFIQRWRDLKSAAETFLATDVEPPLGWTEAEVEARLERLDLELESATRHEISQARAADVRDQLNSQRGNLEQARGKLDELASEIGVSADTRLETGFQLWCRHLYEWQQQQASVERHKAQLMQLEDRYRAAQAETADLLERHGMGGDQPGGSRELAHWIHLLSPRMRQNAERHNEVRAHEHRISELQADIGQLEKARDRIFEQAGLKAGDRDALIHRIDQFEAWRGLEQERRDQNLEIGRLEARLAEEPELIRQGREQAREALEKVQAELSARVAERDQLNQRVGEIQTRHEDLLERRELERLGVEFERSREALSQEFDAQLMAAAGRLIIEDVREAHESDNEPAALSRSAEWFGRFTHHRYRLRFRDKAFHALDTQDGRERSIAELSTGTRVQLLLAVRLAWIERLESQAEPLPVFMDEVLTTTDPDRYRSIVESVQDIVRGDRQMVYLTAQSDDAQAWTAWAGEGPAPHLIDMAEVRKGEVEPLQQQMPEGIDRPEPIPEPEGMDLLDWARAAGVDPISPWSDPGQMHVFHLLQDEPSQVAELIRFELGRLGQLEAFLQSAQASKLIKADQRDRLENRAKAARLILEDWCRRHARPVDDQALSESGAITDHFMDRVRELNESLGRQPAELIDALRKGKVSRFRSDNIDQLEQWLQERGYLADAEEKERLSAARISLRSGLPPEEITQLRAWIIGAIRDPLARSR
ncbi:hypothetical protein [Wenzhouxiangella marina]|uniref:Uncharacterized protein n=1 Tax=Wenzhouxiangella marina TaxID=1579979 RepID=A0A0K0XTH3_9GAMM|nr:hypothetical protein [Wenzhouxiangella marina]AKS40922.1 hypothetical protein WM2015_540 [Wenzhouxiangella marina]MBB6087796.1 DNA repair exonuclease SbcCD ATPase subunit [Wenzhouxiangella marina]